MSRTNHLDASTSCDSHLPVKNLPDKTSDVETMFGTEIGAGGT
jgi:hypothetical protein